MSTISAQKRTRDLSMEEESQFQQKTDSKNSSEQRGETSSNLFLPNKEIVYSLNTLLSIKIDGEYKTLRVDDWITNDPLSLARVQHQYDIELTPHLNRVLFERLRRYSAKEKRFLGLKLNIDFPLYNEPIPAGIPYRRYPVQFYKWWLEHQDIISLSFKERLSLFNKVNMLDKEALIPKHRVMMNR